MKKLTLSILGALFMFFAAVETTNAQSNKEEIDLFQSIFGMGKKALVADFLKVESSDPFWPIYDAYETERKELGIERINLLTQYVENYESLTDEDYDKIIVDIISLRKRTDKLIDTYYTKIKKESGSKTAAQFFQIEGYVLIEVRAAIMEGIPYIGQFDN